MRHTVVAILAILATPAGPGITSAFAEPDGDGPIAITLFTQFPGVVAEAPSEGRSVARKSPAGDDAHAATFLTPEQRQDVASVRERK
jgi:hypothetical protein